MRVLFFGDSITQYGEQPEGYISILRQIINPQKFEILSSGIGGNKIYDLLFRVEEDVLAQNPGTVVVFEGVNDVWHKSSVGTGTDLVKYEKFYRKLIQFLKNQGIEISLVTPACIGEKRENANPQDSDLNQYCDVIRQLAADEDCRLIDFRSMVTGYQQEHNLENVSSGILTTDGVHLNEKGNRLLAEALATFLSN